MAASSVVLLGVPTAEAAAPRPRDTILIGASGGGVLRSDGTVWMAGRNDLGQSGIGNFVDPQLTPVQVQASPGIPLDRVTEAVGGYGHYCALRTDTTVWCWGDARQGRLGNGDMVNHKNLPVRVEFADGSPLDRVVQIRTGANYTTALRADGTVWSWGAGAGGLRCDGATGDVARPVQATYPDLSPVTNIVSVGGGDTHLLMVRADGTAWACGDNADGQVGDGSTINRGRAVQVERLSTGLPLTNVIDLSGIGRHSMALLADGTVMTWGDNLYGQLSDGTTTDRNAAVPAITLSGTTVKARAIAAGQYNSHWIQTDGTVYSSGYGGWYANGDGSTASRSSAVQAIDTSLAVLTGITRIDAYQGVLAYKADGTAWGWGYNSDGRYGTSTTPQYLQQATLSNFSRGTGWLEVAEGNAHAAALRADGTVWAWGDNASAQLGIGAVGPGVDGPPVQVTVTGGLPLNQVIDVAAGANHTVALRADGSVWAWGKNASGQLGDGTTGNAVRAVQVTTAPGVGLSAARAVTAGGDSSYAVMIDGTVRAWGSNGAGQLGDATTTDRMRAVTVQVGGGQPLGMVGSADAGRLDGTAGFAVFVQANGSMWAVGSNSAGQLGDGTMIQRSQAVQVMGVGGTPLADVTDATAGGRFAAARIGGAGTVLAWGSNASGQLGDGSTTSSLVPRTVQMEGGAAVTGMQLVDAGIDHAVSIGAAGTLRTWGSSALGQGGAGTAATTHLGAVAMVVAGGGAIAGLNASAGDDHTGVISTRTDGTIGFSIRSAGSDASGQLGDCGRGTSARSLVLLAASCPSVVRDGSAAADVDGQTSVTTLEANWTGHVDQTLVRYEYCMSTATDASGCSGTLLVGWTDNATATNVTRAGLALAVGSTYYTCVRLVRATTLGPVCSNGVKVDDAAPDVPTLISPAPGASIQVADLTASYSDTYTGGRIEVQVCSDAACTGVVATAQSPTVASGANGTARPVVARGSYFWRARAIDAAGNVSAYSTSRAFSYNAVPVATAISPGAAQWVGTSQPSFGVRHDDADGGPGTVAVEVCSSSAADPWNGTCGSSYQLAQTGAFAVASGTTATLAHNVPLADGTWNWRARSTDELAASSPWTTVRTVRIDTTAPAPTPTLSITRKGSGRLDLSWTAASDAGVGGVTYEIERYDTGTSSWGPLCPTTTSLTCSANGLGSSEILVARVRACDGLNNCGAWSGASAVAASGYLLRNTSPSSSNLSNTQTRVATLPPAAAQDITSTGVAQPGGSAANKQGRFPFRYGVTSSTAKVTATTDPQDTTNGWGWVVDDVEGKALSAGALEAVITTVPAAGASGSGAGRLLCRIWRVTTNGTNAVTGWTHLADANGSVVDVMTAGGSSPSVSTCDLSAALGAQMAFATNEVLYLEVHLEVATAGANGDQYLLSFNDASSTINMPQPGTLPLAPSPASPVSNMVTGSSPVLDASYPLASSAPASLEMELSTDPSFLTDVTRLATPPVAPGANGTVSTGTLPLGTTWHWRVRARSNAGLTSAWSSAATFRTSSAPSAPVPSAPANGASPAAGAVTLSAGAFADTDLPSDSHTASQWQVSAAGSDWSTPAADSGVTTTSLTSWTTGALPVGSWQWRVRYRDQHGVWSAWSSVANPRTFTTTAPGVTLGLSATSLDLGLLATGADAVGTVTMTAGATSANGYTLSASDDSDTSFLACTCGSAIADWTGTDATPAAWSAGASGFGGITVRDAPGGRMAKWGAGTATLEADHAANRYAGLRSGSSVLLHTTSTASTAADVVGTFRANPSASTFAGSYTGTVAISLVANP